LNPNLPLPAFNKRNNARKQIGAIIKRIIKNRRENPNRQGENDIIEVLMGKKFKSDNDRPVSDDEIAGLCVAITLAGQHTSSITSSWLFIYILSHPEVLEDILKEQREVRGQIEHIDMETVEKFNFLHYAIQESLRLRPPIILVWRVALKNFSYKGYVVPKGTLVCVSPAACSRFKNSVFTEAEKYDPTRFNPTRAENKKASYSYLPFSQGKHSCIGEKFAYLQVKTVFSALFHRFNLKIQGDISNYPVNYTTVLAGPVGPLKFTYERKK